VTQPSGAVGYFFDASVTDATRKDATADASGYWLNLKNLHNGKAWFVSGGTKIRITMANLPANVYARTTTTGATILMELASGISLTRGQWGYVIAHELGHVLNYYDSSSCSDSVTVMHSWVSGTFPSLGSSPRNGDRCAYQSGYHRF
jgi:hypothetical protein